MKTLKASDIKPLDFSLMMKAAKAQALAREEETSEVPEEVLAEMGVRRGWPELSPEVRDSIRNGEPF